MKPQHPHHPVTSGWSKLTRDAARAMHPSVQCQRSLDDNKMRVVYQTRFWNNWQQFLVETLPDR